ncbi:MAG: hypothetical protein R3B07_01960 [Polyangiaceae bacterium]
MMEATVFSKGETPPFELLDKVDTKEEIRLQYRFLDLRRAPLRRAAHASQPEPSARNFT